MTVRGVTFSKWISYVEKLKKLFRQNRFDAPEIRIRYLQDEILRVIARVEALCYKPVGSGFDPR